MRAALADGSIFWRKANIIIGKADPKNEASLVDAAKRLGEEALRGSLVAGPEDEPRGNLGGKPRDEVSPPKGRGEAEKPRGRPVLPRFLQPHPEAPSGLSRVGSASEIQHVLFKFTPEQNALWQSLTLHSHGRSKEARLLAAPTSPIFSCITVSPWRPVARPPMLT